MSRGCELCTGTGKEFPLVDQISRGLGLGRCHDVLHLFEVVVDPGVVLTGTGFDLILSGYPGQRLSHMIKLVFRYNT